MSTEPAECHVLALPQGGEPFAEIAEARDPYPLLARLREAEHGFWYLTRYQDIKRVLYDPEHVSQDVRIWERYVPAPEGSFLRWSEDHGIFAMPDRNRARIRRIAATVFSGRGVRRMEEEIRRIVFSASERLSARASDLIDLHAEFTAWVPYAVIGRVVVVDSGGDDARLRRLVRAAL